jgi:hypothetical protein
LATRPNLQLTLIAKQRGIGELVGEVMRENEPMLQDVPGTRILDNSTAGRSPFAGSIVQLEVSLRDVEWAAGNTMSGRR